MITQTIDIKAAEVHDDRTDGVTAVQEEENSPEKLTRLLRGIGAIVLLSAAVTFAIQRWNGWDSIERYMSFLGFTAMISIAGAICVTRLQENKGARTFFAIAAAFLPAHFLQLGALLYSQAVGVPNIPEWYRFVAPSMTSVMACFAIALPVLALVAFAGFSAIARAHAPVLTIFYLLANAALVVPIRDPNGIALLALLLFGMSVAFERLYLPDTPALKTLEGFFVRVMLYAPLPIMFVRNLVLYDPTSLLSASMCVILAALALDRSRAAQHPASRAFGEHIAAVLACVASAFTSMALFFDTGAPFSWLVAGAKNDFIIPLVYLPMAATLSGISLLEQECGKFHRRAAAWIAVTSMLFQLSSVPGIASSFLCILTAIAVMVKGFVGKEKGLLYTGVFGLVCGLLYHLKYAAELYTMSPWLTLAVTGVTLVFTASYLERNYGRIAKRVKEIGSWQ